MAVEPIRQRVLLVAGPNGSGKTTINAARVARRVMQGGHDVPIGKIVSRYFRSIANCASVAPLVDRLYLYDNSVEDAEARLVLRASEGKVIRIYQEPPQWMSPIITELKS